MKNNKSWSFILARGFLVFVAFFQLSVAQAEELLGSEIKSFDPSKPLSGAKPAVVVSRVGFNNIKIASQTEDRRHLEIVFEMENRGGLEGDLHYGLQLEKKTNEGSYVLVDEKFFPEEITLNKGESISRKVDYDILDFFDGQFRLWLVGKNSAGLPRGIGFLGEIAVNGNGQFIEIENCQLKVAGQENRYSLLEGVSYKPEETMEMVCDFISFFDNPIKVSADYSVFRRSVLSGDRVELKTEIKQDFLFESLEKKRNIVFSLPALGEPQAYDLIFRLKDQWGKNVSQQIRTHLVVSGESATITDLKLDKNSYQKKENAIVKLRWVGPADNFPGSRNLSGSSDNSAFLESTLKDQQDNLCAVMNSHPIDLSKSEGDEIIEIPIEKDCLAVQGFFVLKNNKGEVLDQTEVRSYSHLKTSRGKKNIVLIIALLYPLVVLGLIYWKRKKLRKSARNSVVMIIIFLGCVFGTQEKALAGDSATLTIYSKSQSHCSGDIGYHLKGYENDEAIWSSSKSSCAIGNNYYCADYYDRCYTEGPAGDVYSASASFSLDKDTYLPGEIIKISASGSVLSSCNNPTYSSAYAQLGAEYKSIYDIEATKSNSSGNDFATFQAPNTSGDHYLTVYLSYSHPPFYSLEYATLYFDVEGTGCTGSIPNGGVACGGGNGNTSWSEVSAIVCAQKNPCTYYVPEASCSAFFAPPVIGINGETILYWSSKNADRLDYFCSGIVSSSGSLSGGHLNGNSSALSFPSAGVETCDFQTYRKDKPEGDCNARLFVKKIDGQCGSAAKEYTSGDTQFDGAFCDNGAPSPENPSFPLPGGTVSWACLGTGGGLDEICTASRGVDNGFLCTGDVPGNADLCSGDDQDLNQNTQRTLLPDVSCPINNIKCEYVCKLGWSYDPTTMTCKNDGGDDCVPGCNAYLNDDCTGRCGEVDEYICVANCPGDCDGNPSCDEKISCPCDTDDWIEVAE